MQPKAAVEVVDQMKENREKWKKIQELNIHLPLLFYLFWKPFREAFASWNSILVNLEVVNSIQYSENALLKGDSLNSLQSILKLSNE